MRIYTRQTDIRMASGSNLARKNLIVDETAVRALKQALKVSTESEAVRITVRDRLAIEEAQAAFERIRRRGGLDDVFRRSAHPFAAGGLTDLFGRRIVVRQAEAAAWVAESGKTMREARLT